MNGKFFTPSIDLSEFRRTDGGSSRMLGVSDDPKVRAAALAAARREADVRGAALLAQAQQFALLCVYRPGVPS
jgi:hypothetical protein